MSAELAAMIDRAQRLSERYRRSAEQPGLEPYAVARSRAASHIIDETLARLRERQAAGESNS